MRIEPAGTFTAPPSGVTDEGDFDPARRCDSAGSVLRQEFRGLYVGSSSGDSGILETAALVEQRAVVAQNANDTAQGQIGHVGVECGPATVPLMPTTHGGKRSLHNVS